MSLTKSQVTKIKEHLFGQLSQFPEEKREQIKKSIEALSPKELENFLEQNNLQHLKNNCIFCAIANKVNPSVIIAEDDKALAILELNPLSKGHILIVPKKHESNLKDSTSRLLQIVSEKLVNKFSPKEIKSNEIEIMDHKLLEVIPIYGNETERKNATESELQKVQEELLSAPEEIKKVEEKKEPETIPKLKPRIP